VGMNRGAWMPRQSCWFLLRRRSGRDRVRVCAWGGGVPKRLYRGERCDATCGFAR